MLSVLFNLGTQAPSLSAGYSDFRLAVAYRVGYGSDETLWTTDQARELDLDVQEAYRWVLYPQTIPGERIPHTWSFTEQTTTITLTAGTYNYTLPANFGSFVGKYMTWPTNTGYNYPFRTRDTEVLMARQNNATSGRPECFALRWLAQTSGLQQRQEVIFFPTPDATYTLTYTYAILAEKLTVANPYPLGGPRMAQLMIEACKAIGETKRDGQRGDQWNLFIAELQSAIQMDKGTNTSPTVGVMRGSGIAAYPRPIGTVSYYYGPNTPAVETGSPEYVLET